MVAGGLQVSNLVTSLPWHVGELRREDWDRRDAGRDQSLVGRAWVLGPGRLGFPGGLNAWALMDSDVFQFSKSFSDRTSRMGLELFAL